MRTPAIFLILTMIWLFACANTSVNIGDTKNALATAIVKAINADDVEKVKGLLTTNPDLVNTKDGLEITR